MSRAARSRAQMPARNHPVHRRAERQKPISEILRRNSAHRAARRALAQQAAMLRPQSIKTGFRANAAGDLSGGQVSVSARP
jgi:hypothetical protein